ncbi:MAG: MFS transporter [Pseudomonadota bacterium]
MDRETKFVITTLMVVAFMIGTDFIGAALLVTAIEKEFDTDITTTQWVMNMYALTFAVLMVAAGRLGDLYGRRRLMQLGLAIFFVASVACALAPSVTLLIVARGIQGVGASLLWPSIFALAALSVAEERRGLAIGLLLAGVTTGNVVGPLLGGVFTSLGDWRFFFVFNAAVAVIAVLMVSPFVKKDSPEKVEEKIDIAGMAVLGLGVFAMLYGLDVGADWGWSSYGVIGLFVLSALMFIVFPFVEAKVKDPMMPLGLMKNREFMAALWANGLVIPPVFIGFLYFPQYMQNTLGWSVMDSSFGMMPMMIILAVGSILSGSLYAPIGPKRLLLVGFGLSVIGSAWAVFFLDPSWGYYTLLPAMIIVAAGAILCVGTAGTAAVSAVRESRAGLAGGLSFMVHLILAAVGIAGATAIMFSETSGVSKADLVHVFPGALSDAYWIALASAVAGVLVVLLIDEKKLQTVHE